MADVPSGMVDAHQGIASASQAYQAAVAKVTRQRTDLLRQYGYLADFDANSNFKNLHVDPGNPYGWLQQLLRRQAQEKQSLQGSLLDRGIRGGLARGLMSDLRYTHGGQTIQPSEGLTTGLGDLVDSLRQAQLERDRTIWEAEMMAALQAAQNMPPAGPPTGPGPTDYTPSH